MGVSHVAAAVILFAGFVAAGSTALRAAFDTQDELNRAWLATNDWATEARITEMSITNVANQGQNSRIRADNTGETVIDGAKISLVVNGVEKTAQITSRKVEGVTTDVWAPGQEIEIIVPGNGATSVVLAEEHGVTDLWRA